MTNERLMVLAKKGGVSSESMGVDGDFYDGWAGMKMLLQRDPALVRKEKGHRYRQPDNPGKIMHCFVGSISNIRNNLSHVFT